jgi:hypothetical protein
MSQPQWLGLLQWSLRYQDGTHQSEFRQLSAEDRAFLDRVMQEGVKDEAKRITDIIIDIKDKLDRHAIGDIEIDDLEELFDMTEQIDNAQVFVKFGGIKLLVLLLLTKDPYTSAAHVDKLNVLALSLLGSVSQNNLVVQDEAIRRNILRILHDVCVATNSTPAIKSRVIYAFSCIVRSHAIAESIFVTQYLRDVFTSVLSSPDVTDDATRRVLFLSQALASSDGASIQRLELISECLFDKLARYLVSPNIDISESALRLVEIFVQSREGLVRLEPFSSDILESIRQNIRTLRDVLEGIPASANDDREHANEQMLRWQSLLDTLTSDDFGRNSAPSLMRASEIEVPDSCYSNALSGNVSGSGESTSTAPLLLGP